MRGALASAVVVGALLAPASASALDYAPVDLPGPPLSPAPAQLSGSLTCNGNLGGGTRGPVLLVPGTTANPRVNFSWNWQPALTALGIPWCSVELPGNAMADIQVAGEYVVNAIRTMHAASGRRLTVIGHSQGGMVPRWALRFWPDTRPMVDDLIGFAPSNHGTLDAQGICILGCAPSIWQQRDSSEFVKAINSRQETFPGISYTSVFTHTDEVVVPNLDANGSSSLHGGGGDIANIATQDICPLDLYEHLQIGTIDPVAYALALDAIDHPGPADPARVAAATCAQAFMPGVNPLTVVPDFAAFSTAVATTLATYPHVPAEPPLACYVTASCPAATVTAAARKHTAKCRKHRKRRHGHRRGCRHHKKKAHRR